MLQFRLSIHSEQTSGFSFALESFTRKELTAMAPVESDTLKTIRFFLPIIPPNAQPKCRRDLAYLTDLHERQREAWATTFNLMEKEDNRIEQLIKSLENGSITN